MFGEFVGARVAKLQEAMSGADLGRETRGHVDRLLSALEEGAFCFRQEPWHDITLRSAFSAGAVSEMLMHVPASDKGGVNICWAISSIYECGLSKEFDQIVVASALQQADSQQSFPVAINISPESACEKSFWEELAPVLGNYDAQDMVFELIEEEFIPDAHGLAVMKAARKMGYRFALDDVENNARDEKRVAAYGGHVDIIKVCGVMIEEWELGLPGLASFVSHLKKHTANVQFIAEWVSSAAKARLLSELGFHAVQGRYLPSNRKEFSFRFSRTPAKRMHIAHSNLTESFAGLGA